MFNGPGLSFWRMSQFLLLIPGIWIRGLRYLDLKYSNLYNEYSDIFVSDIYLYPTFTLKFKSKIKILLPKQN